MQKIFIVLVLLFLLVGCIGFYYLCNSYAVEQAVGDLVDSIVNLIGQVALGLYYILVGAAIGLAAGAILLGLGFGAKAGAESVGRMAILLRAAPAVRGAIEKGQTTRLSAGYTVERPQTTPYEEFEQPQIEAPMRTNHLLPRRRYGQNAAAERETVREVGSQPHWEHPG